MVFLKQLALAYFNLHSNVISVLAQALQSGACLKEVLDPFFRLKKMHNSAMN